MSWNENQKTVGYDDDSKMKKYVRISKIIICVSILAIFVAVGAIILSLFSDGITKASMDDGVITESITNPSNTSDPEIASDGLNIGDELGNNALGSRLNIYMFEYIFIIYYNILYRNDILCFKCW